MPVSPYHLSVVFLSVSMCLPDYIFMPTVRLFVSLPRPHHPSDYPTDTCRCPEELKTNWWHHPPFLHRTNHTGIFPLLLIRLVKGCCKSCASHGVTSLNFSQDGGNGSAEKSSYEHVRNAIDHRTHLSFPFSGYQGQDHYSGQYGFVSIIQSPGIDWFKRTTQHKHKHKHK